MKNKFINSMLPFPVREVFEVVGIKHDATLFHNPKFGFIDFEKIDLKQAYFLFENGYPHLQKIEVSTDTTVDVKQ